MRARLPSTPGSAVLALLWALLAVAPPAGAAPAGSRWLTTLAEARAKAAQGDRYILVDLYADWCGWCKQLEQKVFSTPEFQRYTADFVLLRVDTEDRAEGAMLQSRFEAGTLPTTLILDADLILVGKVAGFHPADTFIAALEEQINGWRTILSFFDQVRDSDDVELQRQLAEDFYKRGDGERAVALYERVIARVKSGTDAAAWLHYQAADSYRLIDQIDAAESHAKRSRAMAEELGEKQLLERLDLLSFFLAEERGDCQRAIASLEYFLAHYPRSIYMPQARRTLEAIRQGEAMACT